MMNAFRRFGEHHGMFTETSGLTRATRCNTPEDIRQVIAPVCLKSGGREYERFLKPAGPLVRMDPEVGQFPLFA
jgi:hypothetical protein